AMAERIAGRMGPDVLTLEMPVPGPRTPEKTKKNAGGVALAARPPQVRFHARTDQEALAYARKAKAVVVRHTSDHEVIAMVELVSPGNQSSRRALSSFARKAQEVLQ